MIKDREKIKTVISIINNGSEYTTTDAFSSQDVWVISRKYHYELESIFHLSSRSDVLREMVNIVMKYPDIFSIYGISESWNQVTYMGLIVEIW